MTRKAWGIVLPLVMALAAVLAALAMPLPAAVFNGIAVGMGLALLQSFFSTWSLNWAWNKRFFYWVWGGGIFFRLAFLAATAFVVYLYTGLHLVATLISMVSATTIFLVVEQWAFFKKSNGFPTPS